MNKCPWCLNLIAEINRDRATIKQLREAMKAAKRLAAGDYTHWVHAGGGKTCEHGYNEGIPCPACDLALVNECDGLSTEGKP